MANKGRIYRVYEDWKGRPRNHWQQHGEPKVPGVYRDEKGTLRPPRPRWRVRARSANEACLFAYKSTTSQSRDDGLGILSDARDEPEEE